ncbi:FGGY-family carbohydrate kinase [Diplocloster hominis]|uniref:FGGY-family carbohydrate kinase n=1 Tax=Diplocloster hominis TaxID=3079010 RepID=UPI0031BA3733
MPYIGLDIGTSGCKAAALSEEGTVLAIAGESYPLVSERPGWAELDPRRVWSAVQRVLARIGEQVQDIRALSIASLGESFVLLDERDRPLANSMTYLDIRGEEELYRLKAYASPAEFQRRSGTPIEAMYTLPKYLWLQSHEPEIIKKSRKLFLYQDYIGYLLTGNRMIDASLASRTMLLDLRKLNWNLELTKHFAIPSGYLSSVCITGEYLGVIRGESAKQLGLPATVKVFAGCHDQCSAMLGAGVLGEGQIMDGMGSSESLQILIGRGLIPNVGEELAIQNISVEPFVLPQLYAMTLGQPAYGTCIRWFANTFLDGDFPPSYDKLEQICADDSKGCFFLPYLSGQYIRDSGEEPYYGAFLGLKLPVGKAEMYRAVLEGICMETKINCEILEKLGILSEEVTAAGGCSRSPAHMQIKADILECKVRTLQAEQAGIVGLAMICAVALGDCKDYQEAAGKYVRLGRCYLPKRSYHDKIEQYKMLRDIGSRLKTG